MEGLEEWKALAKGLKPIGGREVLAVRKSLEWTVKMVEEKKMRVQKEWLQVELSNYRHRLLELGVIV